MNKFNNILIGEQIRKKRKEKGWNQEYLCELADISRIHLSNIENGTKTASVVVLRRLAVCLDVKLEYLFSGVVDTIDDSEGKTKADIQRANSKMLIDKLDEKQLEYAEQTLKIISLSKYFDKDTEQYPKG